MKHVGDISHEMCTGCKMCGDICPQKAISFREDSEGFWYPEVRPDMCTECGLCARKCPSIHAESATSFFPAQVYAAWSKDEALRLESTSGGIFGELARHILNEGGLVAGSRYGSDWKSAEHILVHDKAELAQICGSKYFQSNTAGIYKAVKTELLSGKTVLFCGTPCQNAALGVFLGKEYENLIRVDFICRSINSPLAFREYLTELEGQYGSEVVRVHLKDKTLGWQSLASHVWFANGQEYLKDRDSDFWVKGFIAHDLYTRESCYSCPYRTLPRTAADITIGDFWGIRNQKAEDMRKGISVVLVNSEKGSKLFHAVREHLEIEEHSVEDALPGNPALLKNPVLTKKRERFFKLIHERPFSAVVRQLSRPTLQSRLFAAVRRARNVFHTAKNLNLSIPKCVYYNFFSPNIVRDRGSYLLAHKGAVLDFHPSARLYLHGKHLEIGHNQLKGSKYETHVRMEQGAVWNCNNGGLLFYNTVLEVKKNAVLDTGFFSANGGSVIIADKHITLGEDVMIGRNVIIYIFGVNGLQSIRRSGIIRRKTHDKGEHLWKTKC